MKYRTRNEKVVRKPREYLMRIRVEKDLSQGDISNRAGIIQSTYSRIENGYKGALMCARQLIALADALEVPLEELARAEAKYMEEVDRANGIIRRWW